MRLDINHRKKNVKSRNKEETLRKSKRKSKNA